MFIINLLVVFLYLFVSYEVGTHDEKRSRAVQITLMAALMIGLLGYIEIFVR